METFYNVLLFMAGLGIFMMSMDMTCKNLQGLMGQSLTKKMKNLTKGKFKGALFGTGATVALQSSTAMIVLLISFVQMGIFSLSQSLPIVIGVNVGASAIFVSLLADAFNISLVLASITVVGAFINILAKNTKVKTVGKILFSFGLLFLGLYLISYSMSFLKSLEIVQNALLSITNPILLVLLGFVLSALTQSSLATNAIIISLCATSGEAGIALASALWLSIGSRIGPTTAGLLATIGNARVTKYIASFHLFFNLIALTLFAISSLTGWTVWLESFNNPVLSIVVFNIICSCVTALCLLPLTKVVAKFMIKLIKRKQTKDDVFEMDETIFAYPELAFVQVKRSIIVLFEKHTEIFKCLCDYCLDAESDVTFNDIYTKNNQFYTYVEKVKSNLSNIGLNISDNQKNYLYFYINIIGRFHSLADRIDKLLNVLDKKPTKNFTKEQINLSEKLISCLFELNEVCLKFLKSEKEEITSTLLENAVLLDSEITKTKIEVKNSIVKSYQNSVSKTRFTDKYARLINQLEQIGEHYSAICFFDFDLFIASEGKGDDEINE